MFSALLIILILIGTMLGAFGSLFLKKGSANFNLNIFKQLRNKYLIIGIIIYVLSAALYVYILTMERLSIIYPLSSLSYIWVSFLSVKFLGEKMNKKKWLGIALIILGISFITLFAF